MAVRFFLRLPHSIGDISLPDPSSGTFDAAGDFDDLLRSSHDALEVLSRADPYDTVVFTSVEAEGMLRDIEMLLTRDGERHGPDPPAYKLSARRGLLRLRVMAACCREHPESTIEQHGD
jgi:hypothetical protein